MGKSFVFQVLKEYPCVSPMSSCIVNFEILRICFTSTLLHGLTSFFPRHWDRKFFRLGLQAPLSTSLQPALPLACPPAQYINTIPINGFTLKSSQISFVQLCNGPAKHFVQTNFVLANFDDIFISNVDPDWNLWILCRRNIHGCRAVDIGTFNLHCSHLTSIHEWGHIWRYLWRGYLYWSMRTICFVIFSEILSRTYFLSTNTIILSNILHCG